MRKNRNDQNTFGKKAAQQGSGPTKAKAAPTKPPIRTARPKPSKAPATPGRSDALQDKGERVAKIIARAGLCSRRDAEAWIAEGRVAVNGQVLSSPAVALGPADQVTVDGTPLAQRQRTRLFLFHKPRGLVTTNKDPEGRATIFDHLAQHAPNAPRLMSIGRLDINTEGLLLLTNDGGLARILELPATGWLRRYRVRANGETNQAALDGLAKGVTIDGLRYAGIEATLDRKQGANCWLTMGLREGKNREIKRVLEHLGLTVNRLIRISFGPFQLGELPDGKIEEARTRVLRDQLGAALTQAAGLDFDAPIEAAPEPTPPGEAKPVATARPPCAKRARPEPEREKIRARPQPGPRKHISALRGQDARPGAQAGRQRTIEGETADRKGRHIVIERRVAAKAATPATPGAPKRNRGPEESRGCRKNFAERPQSRRDDHASTPRNKGHRTPGRGFAPTGKKPRGRS